MRLSRVPEIMRLHNSFMGSLTVVTSALLFTNDLWVIVVGALTYIFIASAQNIINDIFDVEVDRINRPNRPIPSGDISVREAYFLFYFYTILGLVLSVVSSLWVRSFLPFLVAVAMSVVGVLYSWKLKVLGFVGNVTVGVSFSMGYVYGILISTNRLVFSGEVVTSLLLFSVSTTLLIAREIVKGIEDVVGDAVRGVKTLARSRGIKFASRVAAVFYFLALVAFTSLYFFGVLNVYFLPFLVVGDVATVIAIYYSLRGAAGASKASLWGKIGAFDGLVGFLIGALRV